MIRHVLVILGIFILAASCRKDLVFEHKKVNLVFSEDTIFLDTVFATIGSSTRILKVKNPTSDNIYISNVRLAKGNASFYRMNVNGASTKNISDVELLGNDSLYIFIEVTADVAGATELLYTDSIIFTTEGNQQDVDLVTLAKDAYFHLPNKVLTIPQDPPNQDIKIPYRILPCNEVWTADKPHVVYGYAVVDSLCTLTMQPGTEVHFHNGSGLWVYRGGKLLIDPDKNGNIDNPVVIQGDRLEPYYENIPGQWGGVLGGIFIMDYSYGNEINNAVIKNANIAIRVDSTDEDNQNLKITNSFILNNSRVGLYGGFSNIEAENLVVANSGLYCFYGLGGNYSFLHSTFANYWTQSARSTPAVGLANFFQDGVGNSYVRDLENAYFGNCIVYGNSISEFGLAESSNGVFNYQFNYGLLKLDEDPFDNSYDITDPEYFSDCIFNQDPHFVDPYQNNYELDTLSAAMDEAGAADAALVPLDIKGMARSFNNLPDIGAYERYE